MESRCPVSSQNLFLKAHGFAVYQIAHPCLYDYKGLALKDTSCARTWHADTGRYPVVKTCIRTY
jgi:hypothetical protein